MTFKGPFQPKPFYDSTLVLFKTQFLPGVSLYSVITNPLWYKHEHFCQLLLWWQIWGTTPQISRM